MADVIILGTGPAGISASLYTARAGMETLVLGRDGGALEKTDCIDGAYAGTSAIADFRKKRG